MYEHDPQDLPENYFMVNVAGLAKFVICVADEDFAHLRLREYCKDNQFLNIDPDSHFDIFTSVEAVGDGSEEIYRKTQLSHNIVRLVGYTETRRTIFKPTEIRVPSGKVPIQQLLFSD